MDTAFPARSRAVSRRALIVISRAPWSWIDIFAPLRPYFFDIFSTSHVVLSAKTVLLSPLYSRLILSAGETVIRQSDDSSVPALAV